MGKFARFLVLGLMIFIACLAGAEDVATWSVKLDRDSVRAGETARIVITGALKEGWHAYSIVPVPEGPFPTAITLEENAQVSKAGEAEEDPPHKEFDKNFDKEVGFFSEKAVYYLPIKIAASVKGQIEVKASIRFQACNDQVCNPPKTVDLPLTIQVEEGTARPEYEKLVPLASGSASSPPEPSSNPAQDNTSQAIKKAQNQGTAAFILFAFGAGLLSLLTPCVFPMIPITVSFFTKQRGEEDKLQFKGPIAYCLGIILTFTGLGVIVSASGVRLIATNPWVNLGLGILFLVLAASLFGVFELRLPSGLVNKASSKSGANGIVGPLIMGLTFTLTSFTCTVPFVGTLLATSTQGGLFYPIVGMLAFSTAFALPFFLLALFPSFLSKLPRSGAWLVTVKAFMGFLEIMAALKFFSNVDLAFNWGLLTRPVFLAIWTTTAAIGAFYLLGWLKLAHDSGEKPGWLRRGFGVATLGLAVFCLAGLQGRPLGSLSAFLPPDPYPGHEGKSRGNLDWEKTYEAALAKAKETGKNVFIDFTGIYCTNCRDIEENVFTQKEVEGELSKFVLARLFTDQGTPEDNANQELQRKLSGVDTLPLYVVVTPEGKPLKIHQQEPPIEDAEQFLKAIRPFSESKPLAAALESSDQ